ncbi:hypothetical protein BGX26_008330 [Mortierella sp. AD094]|nr:hypothetical protein BGX26_008330 [Mortierella sp. AD094]
MKADGGPVARAAGSPRPGNAFKFELHLRKSDEDQLGHVTNSRYGSLVHDVVDYGVLTGYYANSTGPCRTSLPLPRKSSHLTLKPGHQNNVIQTSEVAVPVGSQFYKDANVQEVYVGYENELKVKPSGIFAWSWVERDKVQGNWTL